MFAEGEPALAVSVEFKPAAKQQWVFPDECEALAFEHVIRAFLAGAFGQLRFMGKQIKLRWRADHMEVNDVVGARAKVRPAGGGIIGKEILIQDTTQAQSANPESAGLEEFAP